MRPGTPSDLDAPLTRDQLIVTAGIMAAIAVAALDSTVVGTAMPTIIGQLGGLSEYSRVFLAHLVTSTTTCRSSPVSPTSTGESRCSCSGSRSS